MAEPIPSPAEKRTNTNTHSILTYLIKRKWKYLFVVALCGISCALFLKFRVLDYSASSSFFVNDIQVLSSAQVDLKSLDNLSPADNFARIYQQVNSTEMLVHLIEKFDLCRHYHIDTTEEFYRQKAISHLSNKISVSKTPFNTIVVTVSDKYRYFAPDIANEILSYLNIMNKKFYIENLEKKLSISHAFLKQMKDDNDQKSKSLDSLIIEIRGLVGTSSEKSLPFWLSQQDRLRTLVSNIENSTHDLMNSERLYNLALQAMSQKDFPTITIVRTAMPASRSNAFMAIGYSLLLCLAVSAVLIFQAYIRLEYSDYIRLFIKSNSVNR
ncbi:MAG: hypothetical protein IPP51_15355 [Bacteroidetes bacterium]|nr:hypothetical protein [Bacteroidota bacterium]